MEEKWTTLEDLLLTHAILKHQTSFTAIARTIRQTPCVSTHLSHKPSFFSPKNCTAEYCALVEAKTGKPVQPAPRSGDFHITLSIENDLRIKRISELESLIAQSNTKIKVIEDDMVAIRNASDDSLEEVIEKLQIDTDQQTENSEEDTEMSGSIETFGDSPGSPSTDSNSYESEATDSGDSDIDLSNGAIKKPRGSYAKYLGKSLNENLISICKMCWRHADGRVFRDPVTDAEAPLYSTIIKNPMDLSTIKKKIFSDEYSGPQDLLADMNLMCNNAQIYNETGSAIYMMADRLKKLVTTEVKLLEEAMYHEANDPVPPITISVRKGALTTSQSKENAFDISDDSSSGESPPPKRRKLHATVSSIEN